MRIAYLTALLLCSGCVSGLERDGRCLATLTPEYLEAQSELTRLQSARRSVPYHAGRDEPRTTQSDLRHASAQLRWTIDWYDRLYQRVQTRLEEREMLMQTFWALAPGPALLFYPLVQWNVHSVMWDGTDPDAESDPLRQFCDALTGRSDHHPSETVTENGW